MISCIIHIILFSWSSSSVFQFFPRKLGSHFPLESSSKPILGDSSVALALIVCSKSCNIACNLSRLNSMMNEWSKLPITSILLPSCEPVNFLLHNLKVLIWPRPMSSVEIDWRCYAYTRVQFKWKCLIYPLSSKYQIMGKSAAALLLHLYDF